MIDLKSRQPVQAPYDGTACPTNLRTPGSRGPGYADTWGPYYSAQFRPRVNGHLELPVGGRWLCPLVADKNCPVADLSAEAHETDLRLPSGYRRSAPRSKQLPCCRIPSGHLGPREGGQPDAAAPPASASLGRQRSDDEYGEIEYGGLPVKYSVMVIMLCRMLFQCCP